MANKRTIHVAGDYFERIEGQAQVTTVRGDDVRFLQTLSRQSPKEEILKLFPLIQQEIAELPLPDDVKKVVQNEITAAELQVKKDPPHKEGMIKKLRAAIAILKGTLELGKETVTLGNMLGKAMEWGGELWRGLTN